MSEDTNRYEGIWHVPERPLEKFHGTLIVSPNERSTLELRGSRSELDPLRLWRSSELMIGATNNGPITLCGCDCNGLSDSIYDVNSARYSVKTALIGIRLRKKEDMKFRCMRVGYSHLYEWVNVTGLEVASEGALFPSKKIRISHEIPAPIHLATINDCELRFRFWRPFSLAGKKEVSISQEVNLEIMSNKEKPLEEYGEILHKFRTFLSLALHQPTFPTLIQVSKEETSDWIYRPVTVHHHLWRTETTANIEWWPFFRFQDVRDNIERYLENWFRTSEQFAPVYDLYSTILYVPEMRAETIFLLYMHAIESYHRRKYDGKLLSPELHKERINRILAGTPTDLQSWLKEELAFSNELSLKERLAALWQMLGDLLKEKVQDPELFIRTVVDTRNYLTHYDRNIESKKTVERDEKNLSNLSANLKILLEACLLTEIGFTKEEIVKLNERPFA